ncbi:MAG: hypothetical protein ABEJ86_04985 [Halococcoides sp.]
MADRLVSWLFVALVAVAVLGASGAAATPAVDADRRLSSGPTYASETVVTVETNASSATWWLYRPTAGDTYMTHVGDVRIGPEGTAVIDFGARDLRPGAYLLGASAYHPRYVEDGVARPLREGERPTFSIVDQSIDARFDPARVESGTATTLVLRSNVASDVVLSAESLSPAELQSLVGGERTTTGVRLATAANRTVPAAPALDPGQYTIRVSSTVGPATDTAALRVTRPSSVAGYRGIDPPADALSPSEVMTARRAFVAGEIDFATLVAVIRAFAFG